ncbi:DUF1302 family protein [Teredinibacter waterburyi]|uniref:DUF1302 family protein n=1 Tax=Teredinibacter waterburyi TaxID=1500538 RepID=UPI00165F0329|nr:DUF1302 family protein [Teredinibacter waterburyi]
MKAILVFASVVLFSPVSALAEEDFFASVEVDLDNTAEDSGSFSYRGYVRQNLKLGIESPREQSNVQRYEAGVNGLRSEGFLEFSGKLAPDIRWQLSTKTELDWVQWQLGEQQWGLTDSRLFLRDAYVDFSYGNNWLRVGHQVLAWGESESLAITDVLSPKDLREPGQAELEDIREALPAISMSTITPFGSLTSVVTFAANANRNAEQGEEFYLLSPWCLPPCLESYKKPDKEWEVAAKWAYSIAGSDLMLMAAEVNDNEQQLAGYDERGPIFYQPRSRVIGGSFAKVLDQWLLRSEFANSWSDRLPVVTIPVQDPAPSDPIAGFDKVRELRAMLGLDYGGFENLQLAYEFSLVKFHRDGQVETNYGHFLSARHSAMNDRLSNQLRLIYMGTVEMKVLRWSLEYQMSDNLHLGASVALYEGDEGSYFDDYFATNDVANLSIKYSF